MLGSVVQECSCILLDTLTYGDKHSTFLCYFCLLTHLFAQQTSLEQIAPSLSPANWGAHLQVHLLSSNSAWQAARLSEWQPSKPGGLLHWNSYFGQRRPFQLPVSALGKCPHIQGFFLARGACHPCLGLYFLFLGFTFLCTLR